MTAVQRRGLFLFLERTVALRQPIDLSARRDLQFTKFPAVIPTLVTSVTAWKVMSRSTSGVGPLSASRFDLPSGSGEGLTLWDRPWDVAPGGESSLAALL